MNALALPGLSRPPGQDPGPRWPEPEAGRLDGLPQAIEGWWLTPVPAGLWLSAAAPAAPADVLALVAEPGRTSLVLDAPGPDPGTDRLLSRLFPVLASAGLSVLRLVLSAAADPYVAAASRTHGLRFI